MESREGNTSLPSAFLARLFCCCDHYDTIAFYLPRMELLHRQIKVKDVRKGMEEKDGAWSGSELWKEEEGKQEMRCTPCD